MSSSSVGGCCSHFQPTLCISRQHSMGWKARGEVNKLLWRCATGSERKGKQNAQGATGNCIFMWSSNLDCMMISNRTSHRQNYLYPIFHSGKIHLPDEQKMQLCSNKGESKTKVGMVSHTGKYVVMPLPHTHYCIAIPCS